MFLYLYPFYMCLFFCSLILCVCLHVLMYVSVFAAVMANKVHYYKPTSEELRMVPQFAHFVVPSILK